MFRNQKKIITIPNQIRNNIFKRRSIFPSFAKLTFLN